jgi:A/G-specific adenine glycosylase
MPSRILHSPVGPTDRGDGLEDVARDDRLAVRAGRARRTALRDWFRLRRRAFPWRSTPESWPVFVAEMLLRRTRAAQVARHLPAILESFPEPAVMAEAAVDHVREELRPLGLVWRADTLKAAAQTITTRHGGHVPLNAPELLALPGVGPYVAFATLTALTHTEVLLVDTNTIRVALRVTGVEPRGDVRRRHATETAIEYLFGGPAPAADWWAVLDLAAVICKPKTPDCPVCPIADHCLTARSLRRGGPAEAQAK